MPAGGLNMRIEVIKSHVKTDCTLILMTNVAGTEYQVIVIPVSGEMTRRIFVLGDFEEAMTCFRNQCGRNE